MIVMETMTRSALGAWTPVAPHVAASPSTHGMLRGPVTLPSTRGQVCPQATVATIPAAVLPAAVARFRADVRGLDAAVLATGVAGGLGSGTGSDLGADDIDARNDERTTLSFAPQYGKTPHDTGTRASRPPA